jgi:hypothetical protein
MPTVTASPGGSSPLVLVKVTAFVRENLSVRGMRVDAIASGTVEVSTGFRLGTSGLLALDSTSARSFKAAARDANGLWSEFSGGKSFTGTNYSAGATEASIGSGATSDSALQSAGITFPDLSAGSGRMIVRRTMVSKTFTDEVRAARWTGGRAAFHVVLSNLDSDQTSLLHRFWRALNGTRTPFFFDYVDPAKGVRTTAAAARYLVRFRDPALAARLFDVSYSELEFYLIAQQDEPEGGDV